MKNIEDEGGSLVINTATVPNSGVNSLASSKDFRKINGQQTFYKNKQYNDFEDGLPLSQYVQGSRDANSFI